MAKRLGLGLLWIGLRQWVKRLGEITLGLKNFCEFHANKSLSVSHSESRWDFLGEILFPLSLKKIWVTCACFFGESTSECSGTGPSAYQTVIYWATREFITTEWNIPSGNTINTFGSYNYEKITKDVINPYQEKSLKNNRCHLFYWNSYLRNSATSNLT